MRCSCCGVTTPAHTEAAACRRPGMAPAVRHVQLRSGVQVTCMSGCRAGLRARQRVQVRPVHGRRGAELLPVLRHRHPGRRRLLHAAAVRAPGAPAARPGAAVCKTSRCPQCALFSGSQGCKNTSLWCVTLCELVRTGAGCGLQDPHARHVRCVRCSGCVPGGARLHPQAGVRQGQAGGAGRQVGPGCIARDSSVVSSRL